MPRPQASALLLSLSVALAPQAEAVQQYARNEPSDVGQEGDPAGCTGLGDGDRKSVV